MINVPEVIQRGETDTVEFKENWRDEWDRMTGHYTLEDIDEQIIREFMSLAQDRLPGISKSDSTESLLQKLGVLVDGALTNAAILLFGHSPQRFFVGAQVHIGRFRNSVTVVDDKLITGNLFQQVSQTMQFFRTYLQVRYEIPTTFHGESPLENVQRQEIWDYPLDALREAVNNALVHRGCIAPGDVTIRVYDDRIFMSNPGELPETLTVESLMADPHQSIRRNPLLAQVFYFAGLIEQWGTGTLRIMHACERQKLPRPVFDSRAGYFSLTFLKGKNSSDVDVLEKHT